MYNNLSDYDYTLPDDLIAQFPPSERGGSRLLAAGKHTDTLKDLKFPDIVTLLNDEYFLILNDSKVLPARLDARKKTGGKAEIFYLSSQNEHLFNALVKGSFSGGDVLYAGDDFVTLEKKLDDGSWMISAGTPVMQLLEKYGKIPLPPYIRRDADENDAERYQTVYAREAGSVAAPTAGLHFTEAVLSELSGKGVQVFYVTLHVGVGTFRPIKCENLSDHAMHSETFSISESTTKSINALKKSGKKALVVGTTAMRAAESATDESGILQSCSGKSTDIFIRPGYRFKLADGLLTNFHLPKSSLLVLVSAFYGYEKTKRAYLHAVEEKYRFFSYGDAMLIL